MIWLLGRYILHLDLPVLGIPTESSIGADAFFESTIIRIMQDKLLGENDKLIKIPTNSNLGAD